jgi:uncharacterized membrane protein
MQYSTGDRQIVLVTDGNSNYGEALDEAFDVAEETGTTVYAVTPELEHNDLSVRIEGEKTALLGNEYNFRVIVSQAGNQEVQYDLKVYIDGVEKNIFSDVSAHKTRQNVLTPNANKLPVFDEVGEHTIEVELIPESEDYEPINNYFLKSVYVIPKPKVRYITENQYQSGLLDILDEYYDVSTDDDLSDLDDQKTVILDNMHINSLNEDDVDLLKEYLLNGGGLVVVGGDRAYDRGEYLDSSLEELLPVVSEGTEMTGGETIVFLIDTSGSGYNPPNDPGADTQTDPGRWGSGPDTIHESTLAKEITSVITYINYPDFRDAKAGVVIFDIDAQTVFPITSLNTEANRNAIANAISTLPISEGSNLATGLRKAGELLEDEEGDKTIIILSDGHLEDYYSYSVNIAKELKETQNIHFQFIYIPDTSNYHNYAMDFIVEVEGKDNFDYCYVETSEGIGSIGDVSNPFEATDTDSQDHETESGEYRLVEYNPSHFISQNSVVTANITGYNDVTPRPGSDRIVLTDTGKPVITTWRYGLGRVVAITTDDGEEAGWSTEMYARNSQLVSASLNWAIADPHVEEGYVVEAEDTWYGLPATLTVTLYDSDSVPVLTYEDEELELSLVSKNTYTTTITPPIIGMHYVSGYPIAVNYGVEYRDVGINEDLSSLIAGTDGEVYTESEAKALLLEEARDNSYKNNSGYKQVSQKMYFILAALLLFLLEVCFRRGREIIDAKKQD